MIKIIFMTCIVICFSRVAAKENDLMAKIIVDSEAGLIASTVTEVSNSNKSLSYLFAVQCFNKCALEKYQELISDTPLGVFRISDINDNLITTWVSGSAYHVRIYGIKAQKVSKIFDKSSLGTPEFIQDENGNESVRIYTKIDEKSVVIESQVWVFDGSEFFEKQSKTQKKNQDSHRKKEY